MYLTTSTDHIQLSSIMQNMITRDFRRMDDAFRLAQLSERSDRAKATCRMCGDQGLSKDMSKISSKGYICKTCARETEDYRQGLIYLDDAKFCTSCHTAFPRSNKYYFYNNQCGDGLSTRCRFCMHEIKNKKEREKIS